MKFYVVSYGRDAAGKLREVQLRAVARDASVIENLGEEAHAEFMVRGPVGKLGEDLEAAIAGDGFVVVEVG